MTLQMRRVLLCLSLAIVFVLGFVASAQAATVTRVRVDVTGVGSFYPNVSSISTTNTARLGTKDSAWVGNIVNAVNRPAVSARYLYKSGRMVVRRSRNGLAVTRAAIYYAALNAVKAATVDGPVVARVNPVVTAPKVPTSKLGKAIKVDKSKRRLWLYNHGKATRITYRVTVGMKGHSTPSGTYIIRVKRYMPTWVAPASEWASNMPRVIKPGPRNPLGLRAMNLYRGGRDTGLRIHGTANLAQIGRAASHGCIRVANSNIVKLYRYVPLGTKVFVQP